MAHQVIYIPGLGDERPFGRTFIFKLWRLFGLKVYYFPLGWADKELFGPKFKRLLTKIDELTEQGQLSLVGESAGASAGINANAVRKNLKNVVLIGGKINNPQTVNPVRYQQNPALNSPSISVIL
jgi:hypothetical protein